MKTRPNLSVTGSVQTLVQSSNRIIASVADAQLASRSNNWPQIADLTISPAFNSKSSWTFSTDGALNITTGTYTVVPQKNLTVNLKMWGEGGAGGSSGGTTAYPSGAGAALTGNVTLTQGSSYYISFFGRGTSAAAFNSNGGNAAGIFAGTSATQAGAVAIAAGGGGAGYDDGSRGDVGGAGGFPSGANGAGYSSAFGRGASNTAGGAAGTASNLGTAGSALQGGNGGTGSGYGGGAGGGGYFGGGGAAIQASWAGAGGGGGSSYANTSLVTGLTHYSGSGTTPGNASDSVRNGAGSGTTTANTSGSSGGTGRIYISSL